MLHQTYIYRFRKYQFPMGKVKSACEDEYVEYEAYQFPMGKVKLKQKEIYGYLSISINSLWER